jgi:hypothetical protein
MEFSYFSLLGGLAMLVVGVLDYALLRAVLYPLLRQRFEEGKAKGRVGMEPNAVMNMLKITNFIVFPVLGLLLGDQALKPFF